VKAGENEATSKDLDGAFGRVDDREHFSVASNKQQTDSTTSTETIYTSKMAPGMQDATSA